MKLQSRTLIFVLFLLAGVSWLVLWQRQREIGRLHTALDAAEKNAATERRVADSRMRALEARLRQHTEEANGLRERSAKAKLKPDEGPTFEAAVAFPFGLKEREEMQRLHALHERAALETRFASLFKALKLSPEKLERLKHFWWSANSPRRMP